MTASLDLAVGSLEVLLALVVLVQSGRAGRTVPWLGVLTLFFALRGADHVYTGISGSEHATIAWLLDATLLAVLVLLIAGMNRMLAGLRLAQDEARLREEEYDRAARDYRRLVRHRLANPVTAILGSAQTLRDLPGLDTETRAELLATIVLEAERLAVVSTEPRAVGAEETKLRPLPQLPARPSARSA
jgi:signal transduction histidine kinase